MTELQQGRTAVPAELMELGKFLTASRASLTPRDVGLIMSGRRRATGLRREEVALLAGVGVSWYTWIEQGRAENVSGEVLDSIARVLRLDENERLYVRRLAGLEAKHSTPSVDFDRQVFQPFVDNWGHNPAFITDRTWNVIVANVSAVRLFNLDSGSHNFLVHHFTDTRHRALYANVEQKDHEIVARFRNQVAYYPDDKQLRDVISQLSLSSERFATLWVKHEVREDAGGDELLIHAAVGELPLHWATRNFPERVAIRITLFHPQVGSNTDYALRRLARLDS